MGAYLSNMMFGIIADPVSARTRAPGSRGATSSDIPTPMYVKGTATDSVNPTPIFPLRPND